MGETIPVSGMSCDGCERAVETKLEPLDGVSDADHEAGAVDVTVAGDVSDDEIHTAVEDAGYEVV